MRLQRLVACGPTYPQVPYRRGVPVPLCGRGLCARGVTLRFAAGSPWDAGAQGGAGGSVAEVVPREAQPVLVVRRDGAARILLLGVTMAQSPPPPRRRQATAPPPPPPFRTAWRHGGRHTEPARTPLQPQIPLRPRPQPTERRVPHPRDRARPEPDQKQQRQWQEQPARVERQTRAVPCPPVAGDSRRLRCRRGHRRRRRAVHWRRGGWHRRGRRRHGVWAMRERRAHPGGAWDRT